MMPIEEAGKTELAKVESGDLAKQAKSLTVAELERGLLRQFPREDAEPWDRTGLLVGDPAALVKGVAVALDVTNDAITAAARAGANVLLTHHPAFIDPPAAISPSRMRADAAGANVYAAVDQGVALMSFHTALDASVAGARLLPRLLSLDFERLLVPLPSNLDKGYGALCSVRPGETPLKLSHLAARCTSVFGRTPRVWGDMDDRLESVVTANGSAGGVVDAAIAAEADCLVCGELKYHASLDAAQAGLAIIELGHDVSELPLCALLAQAAIDAGVPVDAVSVLDQGANWTTPDSTRIYRYGRPSHGFNCVAMANAPTATSSKRVE